MPAYQVLNQPTDWARWFAQLTDEARDLDFVSYIDNSTTEEPALPTIDLDQTTEKAMNVYRIRLSQYEAHKQHRKQLRQFILSTLGPKAQEVFYRNPELSLRQRVEALRNAMQLGDGQAIAHAVQSLEVIARQPPVKMSPTEKLSLYTTAQARLDSLGYSETKEAKLLRLFTFLETHCDASFAVYWRRHCRATPTFTYEDVVKEFEVERAARALIPEERREQQGSMKAATTTTTKATKADTTTKAEATDPLDRLCPCLEPNSEKKHTLRRCWMVRYDLAPSFWVPFEANAERFEKAMKDDPKLEAIVERYKEARKKPKPDDEDGPTYTVAAHFADRGRVEEIMNMGF